MSRGLCNLRGLHELRYCFSTTQRALPILARSVSPSLHIWLIEFDKVIGLGYPGDWQQLLDLHDRHLVQYFDALPHCLLLGPCVYPWQRRHWLREGNPGGKGQEHDSFGFYTELAGELCAYQSLQEFIGFSVDITRKTLYSLQRSDQQWRRLPAKSLGAADTACASTKWRPWDAAHAIQGGNIATTAITEKGPLLISQVINRGNISYKWG